MGQEHQGQVELAWRHIAPGLVYIALIDFLAVVGWLDALPWLRSLWVVPLVVLPWINVIAVPGRMKLMGYHRSGWLASFGWGAVAGGLWRIASLIFNLAMTASVGDTLGWGEVSSAVLIVPWIEETFFRGYLGRGLSPRIGVGPSILIQSVLFTFHPIHWEQGWIHLISIFGFGVVAGCLVEHRQSIWASWGAHAFANLIPMVIRPFV